MMASAWKDIQAHDWFKIKIIHWHELEPSLEDQKHINVNRRNEGEKF